MKDGNHPVEDETVRRQFEWSDTSPSVAVAETVALAADSEPTLIDPLFEELDPGALDAVVRSDGAAEPTVSFTVCEYEVTVSSDGEVVVRPAERSA
ncbi:HalOD1 output domain-containing protein [Halostella salina]|uniref:HalOD1 output domain-containing protein n=1 Tax=Halostella salina TaxID=1547897 RepID=UPI000EF80F0C|nr:HalOD1 output domain-containing protein [Halostella salina]